MNNFNQQNDPYNISGDVRAAEASRVFISNVFSWMTVALVLSGLVAWIFGSNFELFKDVFLRYDPATDMYKRSVLGWVIMFAPLAFIIALQAGFNRFSRLVLIGIFMGFAMVMGLSFSYIFIAYTAASIVKVFLISAGMFGVMAVLGYTTKADLTSFGRILMMGVIGIFIASLVNIFTESSTMSYIISFIGVAVFTGLTAYDMQKLRQMGAQVEGGSETAGKLSLIGATTLYLDFINIFLFLLRIMGDRK
jgi:FtsH-binding integral membrane protein